MEDNYQLASFFYQVGLDELKLEFFRCMISELPEFGCSELFLKIGGGQKQINYLDIKEFLLSNNIDIDEKQSQKLCQKMQQNNDHQVDYEHFENEILPKQNKIQKYFCVLRNKDIIKYNAADQFPQILKFLISKFFQINIRNIEKKDLMLQNIKNNSKLNLRGLFECVDMDYRGFFQKQDVSKLQIKMKQMMSKNQIDHLFDVIDQDKDSKVNFKEFCQLFHKRLVKIPVQKYDVQRYLQKQNLVDTSMLQENTNIDQYSETPRKSKFQEKQSKKRDLSISPKQQNYQKTPKKLSKKIIDQEIITPPKAKQNFLISQEISLQINCYRIYKFFKEIISMEQELDIYRKEILQTEKTFNFQRYIDQKQTLSNDDLFAFLRSLGIYINNSRDKENFLKYLNSKNKSIDLVALDQILQPIKQQENSQEINKVPIRFISLFRQSKLDLIKLFSKGFPFNYQIQLQQLFQSIYQASKKFQEQKRRLYLIKSITTERIFKILDSDQNGILSENDIKQFFQNQNKKVRDIDINYIFHFFHKLKERAINYQEFYDTMKPSIDIKY